MVVHTKGFATSKLYSTAAVHIGIKKMARIFYWIVEEDNFIYINGSLRLVVMIVIFMTRQYCTPGHRWHNSKFAELVQKYITLNMNTICGPAQGWIKRWVSEGSCHLRTVSSVCVKEQNKCFFYYLLSLPSTPWNFWK